MLERLITRVTMSRNKSRSDIEFRRRVRESRSRQDHGYFDASLCTNFVVVRARVRVQNVPMTCSRETSIYVLGRSVYLLERQCLVALGL